MVGEVRLAPFAYSEHGFCQSPPFLTVVVGAVVGAHHLHAEQPSQRAAKRWSNGVNVHNVGTQSLRLESGKHRVDNGFKAFSLWRIHIH